MAGLASLLLAGGKARSSFDHAQMRSIFGFFHIRNGFGIRRRRPCFFREDHAAAVFPGIDRKHGGHGEMHGQAPAGEAALETDALVAEFQFAHGDGRDVEHDPVILDKVTRHAEVIATDVHEHIRRQAIVTDPVIQRPQQIGAV